MIPYASHIIEEDDIEAVTKVLRSGRLTQGPVVEEFEEAFAAKVGAKYAIAVNSGTSALHLALLSAPDGPVETTPLTFIATANAILHAGRDILFSDIDPNTLCMDPACDTAVIWDKANTVGLYVDYAGQPCNYDNAKAFYDFIIADAAHSLGAKGVGTLADVTCFSFHAIKSITTGEGGMVVTGRSAIADNVRALRDHGRVKGEFQGQPGFNFRMTEMQAALGLSQLKKLDKFVARRRLIAGEYNRMFRDLNMQLPGQSLTDGAWHLYVVRVQNDRRQLFRDRLRYLGVETQINYPLVTWFSPYRGFIVDSPAAEKAAEEIVSLPMWAMGYDTMDEVISAVCKAAKETL